MTTDDPAQLRDEYDTLLLKPEKTLADTYRLEEIEAKIAEPFGPSRPKSLHLSRQD